jgi:hypothetical protein
MSEPSERPAMPRWQRAYVIAMCAIIGGTFAYTACDWGRWPKLVYHPLTGELGMSSAPTTIAINYLGVFAWGLGGSAVGAIVGWLLCATVRGRAWTERTLHLFGAWAITGVLLAGAYYTWNLFPW